MSAARPSWYGRAVSSDDPGDDDAVNATQRIGERLAHLRAERKLKISDIARRISVSPSLISQIERGQSRPSVTTLFALAQVLEVPVDAFFETHSLRDAAAAEPRAGAPERDGEARSEQAPPALDGGREPVAERAVHDSPEPVWPDAEPGWQGSRYLLKRSERPTVDIRGGVRWERLTPVTLNDLEFMELVYQPGAESDSQLYRHPGIECVLVTENRLDITVGFDVNHVMAGDSIAFPSSVPHRYSNPTDKVSRAVTVILRDSLSTLRGMASALDQAAQQDPAD